MLETNAMGLGQDLGLLSLLRFVRWLAGYRFSCCDFYLIRTDLKSTIGSRLIWLVWHESSIFPEIIFKPTGSARPKFWIFLACFHPCVGCSRIKRVIELRLFKAAGVFVGANRRTECKYLSGFYGCVRTIVCRVFNFLLGDVSQLFGFLQKNLNVVYFCKLIHKLKNPRIKPPSASQTAI